MDAVRREAAAPPPIPFPWKRAVPGMCAACLALVALFVAGSRLLVRATATQPVSAGVLSAFASILQVGKSVDANWIILALAMSLASVKLSMSFASGRSRW